MTEDLNIVLQSGSSTIIKNKQYLSARDYISPFVERMNTLNATFKCQVKVADQLSISNNETNIIYNRVHVQAILPDTYYTHNDWKKVIGMMYSLDTKIPVVKFYIGDINKVNGNLMIFQQEALQVALLEPDTPIDYSCINNLLALTDINRTMSDNLNNAVLFRSELSKTLGEWVIDALDKCIINNSGKIKFSTTTPIEAYKRLVVDKDSVYYQETGDWSLYNVYNAFASIITNDDKDFINKVEKTLLIKALLHL